MIKKVLSINLFCLAAMSASAQITITAADLTSPVHYIYMANDTIPSISVGAAGTNQTYNLAALLQHTHDTLTSLFASWYPDANFPTANMVMQQGTTNTFAYVQSNADSAVFVGNHVNAYLLGYNATFDQKLNTDEKIVSFPFTYNSFFANDYIGKSKFYFNHVIAGFQVDSVMDFIIVHKTDTTDGWGTLTTPLGVYNVVRTKEIKITHDSTDAYIVYLGIGSWNNVRIKDDTVTSYIWWANGVGFPIATAIMDSTGMNVKKVQWLTSVPVAHVDEYGSGIKENLFPNPAENEISFTGDATKLNAINVFDITGRLINSYEFTNDRTNINTSAYANGMYTYAIIAKDNTIIRGKFIIHK